MSADEDSAGWVSRWSKAIRELGKSEPWKRVDNLRCVCLDPDNTGHSHTCEVTKAMSRWREETLER